MSRDETDPAAERETLAPQTITDRFADLEVGDGITFNDREQAYEVVETNKYSVTVADPNGNHVTLSQNLQTGGWVVHEEVWWIDTTASGD
ncbi:transcriptional regulator [Natrinema sp. SYSU A 869]|uniref:transcriptional regulator n=1 Tax=Natrinema sp. SYSU A 869 TaxID=2871694 RepID=UPI001CA3FB8B|nr:transcriptional regulator [Natrinema sp. SYSU A 869]